MNPDDDDDNDNDKGIQTNAKEASAERIRR